MKLFKISMITALLFVSPVLAKDDDEPTQPLISPTVKGLLEATGSVTSLAAAASIGYAIYELDLNKSFRDRGQDIGPGIILTPALYAGAAVLGYTCGDLAYAAYKSFSKKDEEEDADKKQKSKNSKPSNIASGFGKLLLAGTTLVPSLILGACAYRWNNEFVLPLTRIPAHLDRNDKFKLIAIRDLAYYSIFAAIAAWTRIGYKFARSGAQSFKAAALHGHEDADSDEDSDISVD